MTNAIPNNANSNLAAAKFWIIQLHFIQIHMTAVSWIILYTLNENIEPFKTSLFSFNQLRNEKFHRKEGCVSFSSLIITP